MLNFFGKRETIQATSNGLSELVGFGGSAWLADASSIGSVIASMVAAAHDTRAEDRPGTGRLVVAGDCALIYITGLIVPSECYWTKRGYATSCESITNQVNQAAADPQISKIKLIVDSPGGLARGVDETATVIHSKRGVKPIVSHVVGQCCSAAYYLASAADRIIADPSTWTGCIGAILNHQDVSKFLEQYGIVITHFVHGKHKADGSSYRPLDDQGKATMQEVATAVGTMFDNAVSRNRGVSVEHVAEQFGQGKSFLAAKALEIGLIDAVTNPLNSYEEFFDMGQTETKTETGNETKTETETGNEANTETETGQTQNEALATQVENLAGLVGALAEQVKTLSENQAAGQASTSTDEPAETETSETKTGMAAQLDRIEASLKHAQASSETGASGTDAEGAEASSTSKPPGIYKRRGK